MMKKFWLFFSLLACCMTMSFCFADENTGVDVDFSFYEQWNQQEKLSNGFTREFNNAYNFAYKYWITTMDTIYKAHMNDKLNRVSMAKMLSNYSINILQKTPDTSKKCSFADVSSDLDEAYDNWVTLACQLGIMGVWIENFRPYDTVTRAEFATAIWRLLYNIKDGEDVYYSTHIKSLNNLWVITNTDPNLQELRWYVMIMLMRSAMDGFDPSYRVYDTVPNFVGVVVHPQFYDDVMTVFVYNPNTSWLPYGQWVMIKGTWYERWDYLQIEYSGTITSQNPDLNPELQATWPELTTNLTIKKLGNVRDDFFIKRNNIPYELQYSGYQENPIIESYVYEWEIEDWRYVKHETWYTFTFNDLGVKISTRPGRRYEFPAADPYNLFVRNGVEIRKTGEPLAPQRVEYIKIYSKDANQSLEDVIKERHLNPGCKLESGEASNWFKWVEGVWYYIINWIEDKIKIGDYTYNSSISSVKCFPDDEDEYSIVNEAQIQFFEPANDKTRYYKVRFQNYPTIFGKIETLVDKD